MTEDNDVYAISEASYRWTERVFDVLRRVLKVNFKLHDEGNKLEDGDIFLFNHFARFETFIPQYFIYRRTGAFSRSVAAGELFAADDPFSNYLRSVGAVPNDHRSLLPFLAGEVLHGRKVVVFPEGGMVKDRRVVDEAGGYSIYSRSAGAKRKHHTGAAVLALAVDAFKILVRDAVQKGDARRVEMWSTSLGFEEPSRLVAVSRRPTRVVPANITFYPIRIGDNLLRQGAELLSKGLSRRLTEELLIEGNILLRDTDMDIRFGVPIEVERCWHWWDRQLLLRLPSRVETIDDMYELVDAERSWFARLAGGRMRRFAREMRDDYNASHVCRRYRQLEPPRCLSAPCAVRTRGSRHRAQRLRTRAVSSREGGAE